MRKRTLSHIKFPDHEVQLAQQSRKISQQAENEIYEKGIQMDRPNAQSSSIYAFRERVEVYVSTSQSNHLVERYALLATDNSFEGDKEESSIIEAFKHLEMPFTIGQLPSFLSDTLKIMFHGLVTAVGGLEAPLMNAIGFFILDQTGNSTDQAAFCLYIPFRAICYSSITFAIDSVLTISACQGFSDKSDKSIGKRCMTQALFLFLLYTCIVYLPLVLNLRTLFGILGIEDSVASSCERLSLKNLCSDFVQFIVSFIASYCYSQEIEGVFVIISWGLLVPSAGLCLILGFYFEMGFDGFIIGKTVYQLLALAACLYVYFTMTHKSSRGLCSFKEMWGTLSNFTCSTIQIWVGCILEIIGFEINTLFNASNNGEAQIAALGSVTNLVYFIADFGLGFMIAGRTRMNYLLGAGYVTAAKKVGLMIILSETFMAGIFGIVLYIFRYQVVKFYANHDKVQAEYLLNLLILYCLLVQIDIHYNTSTMLCRSTNQNTFCVASYIFFSVVINAGVCWYLASYTEASCIAYFLAMYACLLGSTALCIARVFWIDWKDVELIAAEK